MAFDYETITITPPGATYPVFADLEDADAYLAASFSASDWRAATEGDKNMALVTATRVISRQKYKGDKTDADQALAFPRKNTDVDGTVDDELPQVVIDASIELASAILSGSDVETEANTTNKLSAIRAGSVSIDFYHGADLLTPERFPTNVQELLEDYLLGPAPATTGVATGTDGETVTGEDNGFSGGI